MVLESATSSWPGGKFAAITDGAKHKTASVRSTSDLIRIRFIMKSPLVLLCLLFSWVLAHTRKFSLKPTSPHTRRKLIAPPSGLQHRTLEMALPARQGG